MFIQSKAAVPARRSCICDVGDTKWLLSTLALDMWKGQPISSMENAADFSEGTSNQKCRCIAFVLPTAPKVPLFTSIVRWPTNGSKTFLACNDHIVVAAGTVQDQDIAALVPAAHNSNMGILRVKDQITDLRLGPGDAGAVAMLGHGSTAVADDVLTACGIVKHPVHKAGTIQAVGSVGAGGAAACRCDLCEPSPAAVPTQDEAFNSDR